jgi:hypothetical protein
MIIAVVITINGANDVISGPPPRFVAGLARSTPGLEGFVEGQD